MVRRITKKSIQKQKGIEICSFGATIKQTGHFLHYEGLLFVFLFYDYKLTLTALIIVSIFCVTHQIFIFRFMFFISTCFIFIAKNNDFIFIYKRSINKSTSFFIIFVFKFISIAWFIRII